MLTIKQLANLLKAGNVPADFSIGGTLTPDQIRAFYSLMIDQSEFLKGITTVYGKKLTIPISVRNMGNRVLVRVAEGSEPTSDQKAEHSQLGKNLLCRPVQLFYTLPFQTIEDNADDPEFENRIAGDIAIQFSNDIADLGVNGVADGDAGATFLNLCKGWITLAKASSYTSKINTNGDIDLSVSFGKILAGYPAKFKNPNCRFFVSPNDKEAYQKTLGGKDSTANLLMTGNGVKYLGYDIQAVPYMPDGTHFFCDQKEFILGLVLGIKKYREVKGTKRCVDYTYDFSLDYDFGREHAVAIGYDQGEE